MKVPEWINRILKGQIGQTIFQFLKFGAVGLVNTTISISVYYIFLAVDERLYLVGNIAGFLISTLNAYWLNHRYVFGRKDNKTTGRTLLFRTYLAYGFALGVSTALLYGLVHCLKVAETLAPLGCLLVTVPMNYLVNRFCVYQARGKA